MTSNIPVHKRKKQCCLQKKELGSLSDKTGTWALFWGGPKVGLSLVLIRLQFSEGNRRRSKNNRRWNRRMRKGERRMRWNDRLRGRAEAESDTGILEAQTFLINPRTHCVYFAKLNCGYKMRHSDACYLPLGHAYLLGFSLWFQLHKQKITVSQLWHWDVVKPTSFVTLFKNFH